MNSKNLNEMADYLDRGEFGGREFSMGCFQSCVLGQYAARELEASGRPVTVERIGIGVGGVARKVFGIDQETQTDEWAFAFGAQWGNDHRAAADRLRYLALHGGAPDRSVWEIYRTRKEIRPGFVWAGGAALAASL